MSLSLETAQLKGLGYKEHQVIVDNREDWP